MADKTADLAGPGIGDYGELAKELPSDYEALLTPMERMKAVFFHCGRLEYKAYQVQGLGVRLIFTRPSRWVDTVYNGVLKRHSNFGSKNGRYSGRGTLSHRSFQLFQWAMYRPDCF